MKKFKDITKEQITKWKQTKGKLKRVSIPINGTRNEFAKYIICRPTRGIVSALADAAEKKDSDKAQDLLINNCVLGGDMDLIDENDKDEDVSIYLTLLDEVGKLMETGKVKSVYI